MTALSELDVLVLDCQATGATPTHGWLLEIGWTFARASGETDVVHSHPVALPEGARIPAVVSRLTGIVSASLESAITPEEAWRRLCGAASTGAALDGGGIPTVIHFARFELTFLRDLHARFDPSTPFPFQVVCAHDIARRLFPDLPRRGLRALAGYFGHGLSLNRRSAGHAEATALVWKHLVAELSARGVHRWSELTAFLEARAPTSSGRRAYPLPRARRLALPDAPGVYRMLRSNGDVLYVGKATSLRRRVSGHFTRGGRADERALEMLTQARDLDVTCTASTLEAALLETDEIKKHDPPYNLQLREQGRSAWFVSRDLGQAATEPDATHVIGPLPSKWSLWSYGAIRLLAQGEPRSSRLRARAVSAPAEWGPDEAAFDAGWASFVERYVAPQRCRTPSGALLKASKVLLRLLGEDALDQGEQTDGPRVWDPDRVRRHLERSTLSAGQLMRRARWLCILSDSAVAFQERAASERRLLVMHSGDLVSARALDLDEPLPVPEGIARTWRQRQEAFDATRYDRMRVLATELKRVLVEGGTVAVRVNDRHTITGDRLQSLLRYL